MLHSLNSYYKEVVSEHKLSHPTYEEIEKDWLHILQEKGFAAQMFYILWNYFELFYNSKNIDFIREQEVCKALDDYRNFPARGEDYKNEYGNVISALRIMVNKGLFSTSIDDVVDNAARRNAASMVDNEVDSFMDNQVSLRILDLVEKLIDEKSNKSSTE